MLQVFISAKPSEDVRNRRTIKRSDAPSSAPGVGMRE